MFIKALCIILKTTDNSMSMYKRTDKFWHAHKGTLHSNKKINCYMKEQGRVPQHSTEGNGLDTKK